MTEKATNPSEREQRLDEAIAAFYQAREAGQALDRSAFLTRYSDLAGELAAFLDDKAAFDKRAGGPPAPASEAATLAPTPTLPAAAPLCKVAYFGDYELVEEIARGGMGVVYKARQVSLNRPVALKMILAGQLASPQDVQRFLTEAEAAANLDHPHIVPICEVGQHGGQHYFSMKLIDGDSLAHTVVRDERRGVGEQQRWAAQLISTAARAVHYAHQRGILHRDLKPANILLDTKGEPHVTDFGLAKRVDQGSDLTLSGAIVGTPSYMAPEQARAEKVLSTAADTYSLGAILYELLTSQPPFRAATALDTIMQVLEQEPVAPSKLDPRVDLDLETICLKCLDKEPHKRYASAEALAQDLDRFLEGNPVSARPLGEWESAVRWAKKHPITAALSGLMGIGSLIVQFLFTTMSFIPRGVLFVEEFSFTNLAFAAWAAGFLATMAILVRPRRWVVSGVILFLLVTLGLPCIAYAYLTPVDRPGDFHNLAPGFPTPRGNSAPWSHRNSAPWSHLFVALGLGVGVFLASVYGAMSRSIARRHKTDMLTVFCGGVPGVICLMTCFGCLSWVLLFMLVRGGYGPPDDERSKILVLGTIYLLMFIGSLVGFWLGGTFVARFVLRRTAPVDATTAKGRAEN